MCNLCKSVDHKANVCPFSWACEPTGASPPHEDVISVPDPVCNDNTVNGADNHNETDDDMTDEEEENEEQLHATSNPDDIFVAAAGTSLTTPLNTDSLTDDVCTNKIDDTPQETADSPVLFSVDNTEPKLEPQTCKTDGH